MDMALFFVGFAVAAVVVGAICLAEREPKPSLSSRVAYLEEMAEYLYQCQRGASGGVPPIAPNPKLRGRTIKPGTRGY